VPCAGPVVQTVDKTPLLPFTGTRNVKLPVRDPTNPYESDSHWWWGVRSKRNHSQTVSQLASTRETIWSLLNGVGRLLKKEKLYFKCHPGGLSNENLRGHGELVTGRNLREVVKQKTRDLTVRNQRRRRSEIDRCTNFATSRSYDSYLLYRPCRQQKTTHPRSRKLTKQVWKYKTDYRFLRSRGELVPVSHST